MRSPQYNWCSYGVFASNKCADYFHVVIPKWRGFTLLVITVPLPLLHMLTTSWDWNKKLIFWIMIFTVKDITLNRSLWKFQNIVGKYYVFNLTYLLFFYKATNLFSVHVTWLIICTLTSLYVRSRTHDV